MSRAESNSSVSEINFMANPWTFNPCVYTRERHENDLFVEDRFMTLISDEE